MSWVIADKELLFTLPIVQPDYEEKSFHLVIVWISAKLTAQYTTNLLCKATYFMEIFGS